MINKTLLTPKDVEIFLHDRGITAKVTESFDSYAHMWWFSIETESDESTIKAIIEPHLPIGITYVVKNPEKSIISVKKICICFGPPLSTCPIHGKAV